MRVASGQATQDITPTCGIQKCDGRLTYDGVAYPERQTPYAPKPLWRATLAKSQAKIKVADLRLLTIDW